ncbi:hypothetical protein JCM10207_008819 [Rhodosporidiobolus poonsookiae]
MSLVRLLRPRCARAYSTRPELPSPLQRELFRSVAQPVAVVSTFIPSSTSSGVPPSPSAPAAPGQSDDAQPPRPNHGATLSSLSSISLSPPLVSFSLRLPSRLAAHLSQSPSPPLRIHLLSASQEPLARAFARQLPLPAPAAPSPPPTDGSNPWEAPFEPRLFEELDEGAIGWMECRVVERVGLSRLGSGAGGSQPEGEGEKAPWQPRSELFIAEVERVQLGKGLRDRSGEGGVGSLTYWEQGYHAVPLGSGDR